MTPYFTTKKTGTGLGLPIVSKIINEHSGNFSIKNKRKETGSIVTISLPKYAFKEILVIDDNPDIRFLICNILEEQNFKVRSAANYDQAVLEINDRLPDLAIIDIKLDKPDKDGIDLLKLINLKSKLVPIIMISGHATVQIAVEAIRLGAYEFIEKPFSKEKILNYVKRGLESASLKKEKDIIENKLFHSFDLVGKVRLY